VLLKIAYWGVMMQLMVDSPSDQMSLVKFSYFTKLFNRSLATGHFPSEYKEAFITPIIKKAGLDTTDVSSFRPISNLSVVSQLLERIVVRQRSLPSLFANGWPIDCQPPSYIAV